MANIVYKALKLNKLVVLFCYAYINFQRVIKFNKVYDQGRKT